MMRHLDAGLAFRSNQVKYYDFIIVLYVIFYD